MSALRMLVCIKQVPASNQVKVDPDTGVLLRHGVESKLNPYDLYALETALRLKETYGGTVTALSMGPPQAESVLREAFSMGADEGFLLSDRKFGGADVLATSYVLSLGVQAVGPFDLILCGKQTTDGDTAQVGSALAEQLSLPGAANVCAIDAVEGGGITVTLDLGHATARTALTLPCVLSVEQGIYQPRLPSYRRRRDTADRPVRVLALSDLPGGDESRCGLNGSPTQVRRIFPPEARDGREVWRGTSAETAHAFAQTLRALKYI